MARFPDAPTERGVKHLKELIDATKNGYEAYVFFIVQMEKCTYFTPNRVNHPEFADALTDAKNSGVNVIAVNSKVTTNSITVDTFVNVVICNENL